MTINQLASAFIVFNLAILINGCYCSEKCRKCNNVYCDDMCHPECVPQ